MSKNRLGHAFEPRTEPVHHLASGRYDRTPEQLRRDTRRLPPNPWLCMHCGLAEARHDETELTRVTGGLPYRCPNCVQTGTDPCTHQRTEEVDGDH